MGTYKAYCERVPEQLCYPVERLIYYSAALNN